MVDAKVAVFWDYESARVWAEGIQVPLADKLIELVKQYGPARILRVYSKWVGSNPIVQGLYSMGFQTIHSPMGKKNSVDVMLAVDCISCCWERPEIDTYVIVSGDKDYISVVNYLKLQEKKVVIVGPSKISSEHLQLSATEFISFEDLAGTDTISSEIKDISSPVESTISYSDAIECLHKAIATARDEGRPTRYEVVDPIMRNDDGYDYSGYGSIEHPSGKHFKSFGDFISIVLSDTKVVAATTGLFTELFLPEEDPAAESSFTEESDEILPEHWGIVIDRVELAFSEGNPNKYLYGRFNILYQYVRTMKKEGKLPVKNKTIKEMLSQLVQDGLLVRQEDESYRLTEDLEEKKAAFLTKMGC